MPNTLELRQTSCSPPSTATTSPSIHNSQFPILIVSAALLCAGCRSEPQYAEYDTSYLPASGYTTSPRTTSPQAPPTTTGPGSMHEQSSVSHFAAAESAGIGPNGAMMQSVALTNDFDPEWLQPPRELFKLGPGDKIEIEIIGEPTSKAVTVVAPDGKIYFDLLPGIDVWGMTLSQAKARLEQELGKYVRQQPEVSLVLRGVESKHFWILGRVQAPGVYPMASPLTVLEAVSLAGGTMSLTSFRDQEVAGIGEELADLKHSFVLRSGHILPIDMERLLKQGDLSQNVYLQPDDFLYFPAGRAREVYVLGAVTQARAVPFQEGMTAASAIASAYGTVNGAYMTHVAVVRGSLSHPEIAIINYRAVIRGKARDMALQPQDIVYVPSSPYRYIQRYLELILNTFASSAAINAGINAVGVPRTGFGTGVFIPVGSGIQVIPPANPPPIH